MPQRRCQTPLCSEEYKEEQYPETNTFVHSKARPILHRILLVLAVVTPSPLKVWLYRNVLRWNIGRRVRIGFSYLDSHNVTLEDDVRIGHFNVIRALQSFQVGHNTYIANFNQIFGGHFSEERFRCAFRIGSEACLMSHHFIDAVGVVVIGNRTTVGGRDTHFWSHTLNLSSSKTSLDPTEVIIGDDVYIGARATLVSCRIPDGAVVGAGSVVAKNFLPEAQRLLIAGNPAAVRKRYERESDRPE